MTYPDNKYPKIRFKKDGIIAWIRHESDRHIILICQDLSQYLPLIKPLPDYEIISEPNGIIQPK